MKCRECGVKIESGDLCQVCRDWDDCKRQAWLVKEVNNINQSVSNREMRLRLKRACLYTLVDIRDRHRGN